MVMDGTVIYKTSWTENQPREWDFAQQVLFSINLDMVWEVLQFYVSEYLKLLQIGISWGEAEITNGEVDEYLN